MIHSDLITHNIYTYGFHIIDNFLDESHYQALRSNVQEMDQKGLLSRAKIGVNENAHQNETIRGDETLWIDEQSEDPAVKAYLEQTNKIAKILNQSLFLGLIEFETHYALYQPGTYYKKHIDQFATTKDRKISCVYYLNSDWQNNYGGELKLYNQNNQLIQEVFPQGNRFICFNSELPHEVCITHQPRFSIAGWMKNRSMVLA